MSKEEGIIELDLKAINEKFYLKISDNGGGISSQLSERIFQPNFTTKSGGMGLGLAIVKSIIQGIGGEISYTSVVGDGTTFIIIFPPLEATKQKGEF